MSEPKTYPILRHNLTIKTTDELGFTSSCISCANFAEESEYCKKFNARPPARIIAFGYAEYFDREEIPF